MTQPRARLTHADARPISAESFASAMPLRAEKIAVGVSGGADSMALALLAADWAKQNNAALTALTVDHRLRNESAQEAGQVGAWLKLRGVAHEILAWEDGAVVRRLRASAQDAAREARLKLLTGWCRANGYDSLLLAHHADDQIETFFMRLARGSGLTGLAAMEPVTRFHDVKIIRPLLPFSKAELIATCRAVGQDWVDDASNIDAKYARTRFRKARAFLEAEGFTRERILSTIAHLQRAKAAISAQVGALHDAACLWSGQGAVTVSAPRLLAAPEDVALRLLGELLTTVGGHVYGPRFESLKRLFDRLQNSQMNTVTLHGCCIARSGDVITLQRETAARKGRASRRTSA
jgi:tRNA(Ile)-lysidine synthase